MADQRSSSGAFSAAEMAELLGVYIDETGEQCEQLVQALLALESNPADASRIAVAFRMVHSIKGSAAMLGFDRVTAVAHHLESHFEKLRSGTFALDRQTIQVSLACVDYFRACNERLRAGEPLDNGGALIDSVKALAPQAAADSAWPAAKPAPSASTAESRPTPELRAEPPQSGERDRVVRVRLAAGLAMPDVKIQLVVKRLSGLGTLLGTEPPMADFAARPDLRLIDVFLRTAADGARLVIAGDADGVDCVELDPTTPAEPASLVGEAPHATAPPVSEPSSLVVSGPVAAAAEPAATVVETMRVGVDRLDVLVDLAGELVVNRARFAQLVADMAPLFRKTAGQTAEWQEGQRRYGELVESVDQLTRVVDSLQRGVLGTRMVPIGPLFGRFRRSVRDIAHELGKQVTLELVGEQTELDKRMIDELGDPLVHLVRNAVDHGIEPAEVRVARGKPGVAILRLEASHRGNEVVIAIVDDGGGIDVGRIRERAVARGLVTAERAATLSPRELVDFIWQPGFSTAQAVSNISGRGVGMDIVRTKIEALNGSIDVDSVAGVGTTFTIRLPLTLAISRCMLFRLAETAFAIPVEHVREIVTVSPERILTVAGRLVCDIRGEFLPLVEMRDVFAWPGGRPPEEPRRAVLVIRAGGRAACVGVPVLLGTRDLVVKPLDENFRRVRGLGGASVLGDGEVCLLIDASTMIDMATRSRPGEEQR